MKTVSFEALAVNHIAKCGLIVLQSDVTIEDEFRYYFDSIPVSLLVSRIPFENEVTIETLQQMEGHIQQSMSLFPLDASFDCVGYGCTSGALHIGSEKIAQLVKSSRPTRHVSNPMFAVNQALKRLDAKNIAYLAPYSHEVSQSMVNDLGRMGFKVPIAATFDEKQDQIVGRISPQSIKQACLDLAQEKLADIIFVSCTNMKCAQIIPEVEEIAGVTVISSNQALAWHMADQLNLAKQIEGKGRLFQC